MSLARRLAPTARPVAAESPPPESGDVPVKQAPESREPEMESDVHLLQLLTLLSCLRWWWRERKDFYATGNLSIYYRRPSPRTGRLVRKKLEFRGPDFFVVFGAKPKARRNSWVVEDEGGKFPNVIVEILSKSTSAVDRGEKKELYQNVFKTPEYYLYDPESTKLEGYRLKGRRYMAIRPDGAGRLWSEELGMYFGRHDGQLRFFTREGSLVPLPEEAALAQQARAERAERERAEEHARAEQEKAEERARAERAEREKAEERARAERAEQDKALLIAKLRAMGIDPDTLK